MSQERTGNDYFCTGFHDIPGLAPGSNMGESPYELDGRLINCVLRRLAAEGLRRYPRRAAGVLEKPIAQYYGIGADQVLVTRGCSEALYLVFLWWAHGGGADTVRIPAPSWPGFGTIAHLSGLRLEPYSPSEPVRDMSPGSLAVVCTPDNPTGLVTCESSLLANPYFAAGRGVLDLTYDEYTPSPLSRRLGPLLARGNVACLSLSKSAGVAAARLGLLFAHRGFSGKSQVLPSPIALTGSSYCLSKRCSAAPGSPRARS